MKTLPFKIVHDFVFGQTFSTTPSHGGWTIKDTSATGTPTYAVQSGGGLKIELTNNSQAEIVTLYQNDVLSLKVKEMHRVDFFVRLDAVSDWNSGSAGTNTHVLAMGLASAQNDAVNSIATSVLARVDGADSGTVYWGFECDDNVTDTAKVNSNVAISANTVQVSIDFTLGYDDVRFFVDGVRCNPTTTYNMSNVTLANSYVQPFLQLQKSTGTTTPAVWVERIEYAGVRILS